MKIYVAPNPPQLLRINIKKQGCKTEFITICECAQNEFRNYVKRLILKQNISIFEKGKLTNIEIRMGEGKLNLKSISVSFRGLDPKEVYNLIINDLKTKG